MRPTRRFPARALIAIILSIAFVLLGMNVHYRAVHSPAQRSDFPIFHAAARGLPQGQDIYEVRHARGWEFYYPPGMAAVLVPLGALPLPVAVVAWYALGVFALAWAARRWMQCAESMLRLRGVSAAQSADMALAIVLLAGLANMGPIVSGLQRGQISTILFALMSEAAWRAMRGRDSSAGLFLSIAIGLKVYPALLLLPLACLRKWRSLAACMLGLIAWAVLPLLVAGPRAGGHANTAFVERVLLPTARGPQPGDHVDFSEVNYFGRSNQSLLAVLGRWLGRDAIDPREAFAWAVADWPLARLMHVNRVLSLGLIVALAAAFALRARWAIAPESRAATLPSKTPRADAALPDATMEAALWSVALVAPCAVTLVAWHHYYTVLLAPYAVSITLLFVLAPGAARRALATALAIGMIGNWVYFAGDAFRAGWELRQSGSLLLASLLLCVVLAIVALLASRTARAANAT